MLWSSFESQITLCKIFTSEIYRNKELLQYSLGKKKLSSRKNAQLNHMQEELTAVIFFFSHPAVVTL